MDPSEILTTKSLIGSLKGGGEGVGKGGGVEASTLWLSKPDVIC